MRSTIPTKVIWKSGFKEKFNVKDGLSSRVKMGDAFDEFHHETKMKMQKEPKECREHGENLELKFQIYIDAFDAKYGQTKPDAENHLGEIMNNIQEYNEKCDILAHPDKARPYLLQRIHEAKELLGSLESTDRDGNDKAYRNGYRKIGTAMKALRLVIIKGASDKEIIQTFHAIMTEEGVKVDAAEMKKDGSLLGVMMTAVDTYLQVTNEYSISSGIFVKKEAPGTATTKSIALKKSFIRNRTNPRRISTIRKDIERIERQQKKLVIKKSHFEEELDDVLDGTTISSSAADSVYWV